MSRYASPAAFKQALEQRLRSMSTTGLDFARRRQLLVFDRFLARVMAVFGDRVILKGGLVVELRLERARTTKDIDLRLVGSPDRVLEQLQEAGRMDLGDFMTFEVAPDAEHPEIRNDGMKYEGRRHKAEARLAGKLYGQAFGVDVAFADPLIGEPDILVADDVLSFHGVAPPTLRLYTNRAARFASVGAELPYSTGEGDGARIEYRPAHRGLRRVQARLGRRPQRIEASSSKPVVG